jgi:hypothetical protein
LGRGNLALKMVSKSSSEVQCHSGTLPNNREGISVSAFLIPGMCIGVMGHDRFMLSRGASARTSWAAIRDFLDAILVTQLTVGELSLNRATCLWASYGAIPSRHNHKSSSPAISKSEFEMEPVMLSKETSLLAMLVGHCRRKTVGGKPESSPRITPPTPWLDASTIPM